FHEFKIENVVNIRVFSQGTGLFCGLSIRITGDIHILSLNLPGFTRRRRLFFWINITALFLLS
ncbi:hypothetical protein, partial [Akkermansia sp.]